MTALSMSVVHINCACVGITMQITKSEKAEKDRVINDGTETRDGTGYETVQGAPSTIIQMADKTPPSNGSLTLIDQLQLARQITLGMVHVCLCTWSSG